MRVAQVATLSTPVREDHSGSVEGLVWLLTRELVRLGHHVTVFAAAGSESAGELVATLPGTYAKDGAPGDWSMCEIMNLARAAEESSRFDVVHSHSYLYGLAFERLVKSPLLHTMHTTPSAQDVSLRALAPGAIVSALSATQWSEFPSAPPHAVIHHGVDPQRYGFQAEPEDYLLYLGRFTPGKGVLDAIALAHATGRRLVLAGPRNSYFEQHVAPHVDGRQVEYVGYTTGREKSRLLGAARALVYPVRAPEPFGLVLIEAMMCGTPVLATRVGAVTEVVDEGVTGHCSASTQELAQRVEQLAGLDRALVRERALQRFSARRMASEYAGLYAELVARTKDARFS